MTKGFGNKDYIKKYKVKKHQEKNIKDLMLRKTNPNTRKMEFA